jgi:predicted transcriptional regulator
MTQHEILKKAINKAGGKRHLAELMNIPPARVYEWEKGTAMRFDTMIELLSVVGVELVIKK